MSVPTQFGLSEELARLVPIAPIAVTTTEALLGFVITCQGSGSDVIVEEGLVNLFGRCRIESSMETVFQAAAKVDCPAKYAQVYCFALAPVPQ